MSEDLDEVVKVIIQHCRESENLDFKVTLNLSKESEKKELAKDIAAMANTFGGRILVGVRDGDCEVIGIDKKTFNPSIIHQISNSRVSPPVHLAIDFVDIETKEIAVLSIPETGYVHELQQGRVPVRRGETTQYATVEQIFEMKLRANRQSQERIRKAQIEDSNEVSLPISSGSLLLNQQTRQVEKLLYRYSKNLLGKQTSLFSKEKREMSFLNLKRYERFCRAFLAASEIATGKPLELDRKILDSIAFRSYGILAELIVGEFQSGKTISEKMNKKPIELHLKLDPMAFRMYIEGMDKKYHDDFFQWAGKYADYKSESFDREIMDAFHSKNLSEIIEWILDNFDNPNEALNRGSYLLSLNTQMNNLSIEAMEHDRNWVWKIPLNLMRKNVSTLQKDSKKY
jgi:hypothetical protein